MQQQAATFKWLMRFFSLLFIPTGAYVPAGVATLWVSNSLFGVAQVRAVSALLTLWLHAIAAVNIFILPVWCLLTLRQPHHFLLQTMHPAVYLSPCVAGLHAQERLLQAGGGAANHGRDAGP